ncbi:MAG: hypothetical protein DMF65_09350 [Acidobacteria bacterium]|nr:MAG: hypothetical protein DMF65_09350 [Acidobacteriota bacterium]
MKKWINESILFNSSFIIPHSSFNMSWLIQFSWIIFFVWLLGGALTLVALARRRVLRPSSDTRLCGRAAPRVSVLVPARNEEHRVLLKCVRSILAQDYGDFEVVAVNDRSTDATGPILHALAAGDERLRVVEGAETPAGWLGKPFALQQALAASRGSWILSTDADMIFHPAALRTALEYACARGCDTLALVPYFESVSFWERVLISAWAWAMLVFFPPELINHPKSPLAVGVGGFFLIRRDALERVGGFASIRAEVLDDMRLAEILKRAGARTNVEHAPDLVSTRMYTNLREIWEGASKNWFAVLKFSLSLTLLMLACVFLVTILPPALAAASALAVALGSANEFWRHLLVPTLSTWAVIVSLLALVNRKYDVPFLYALTAPLGWVMSCAILIGSAYGVLTGRGLTWKGRRFYARGGVRPPRASR